MMMKSSLRVGVSKAASARVSSRCSHVICRLAQFPASVPFPFLPMTFPRTMWTSSSVESCIHFCPQTSVVSKAVEFYGPDRAKYLVSPAPAVKNPPARLLKIPGCV